MHNKQLSVVSQELHLDKYIIISDTEVGAFEGHVVLATLQRISDSA